jgi:ubiquinone/menaquinone biosynthesis C-methylase UbiE
MPRDPDVAAFAERAEGYEEGWLGRLHHEIAGRTAELALAQVPAPRRVLDVACGTGYLLRQLAARAPEAVELAGVDAAAEMVRIAQESTDDPRARFRPRTAEHLPEPEGTFDLVVSSMSCMPS